MTPTELNRRQRALAGSRVLGPRLLANCLLADETTSSWKTNKLVRSAFGIDANVSIFASYADAVSYILSRHSSSAMTLVPHGDERVLRQAYEHKVMCATEDVLPSQRYSLIWLRSSVTTAEELDHKLLCQRHDDAHVVIYTVTRICRSAEIAIDCIAEVTATRQEAAAARKQE